MTREKQTGLSGCGGHTLPEVMIAASISLMIAGTAIGLFTSTMSSWNGVKLRLGVDSDVNLAMSRMVYGMGGRFGLRCAASESVAITPDGNGGWTVQYNTGGSGPQTNSFTYSAVDRTLVFNPGSLIVGRNLSLASVVKQDALLVVTLRLDKADGARETRREIASSISFRNQ